MKLSQDMIFYTLSRNIPVHFVVKADMSTCLERPLFYENGMDLAGHVVIIKAEELEALSNTNMFFKETLFVCLGDASTGAVIQGCSVIVVERDMSPIHIFNHLYHIFSTFDQFEQELKRICYEGGTFQDLIDCCDPVIFDPLCIVDKDFHYVAYSKISAERGLMAYVDADNNVPLDVINEVISDPAYLKLYNIKTVFVYSHLGGELIGKNLFDQGGFIARLIAQPSKIDELLLQYYVGLFEHICFYIEKLHSRFMSFNVQGCSSNCLSTLMLDCLNSRKLTNEQFEQVVKDYSWGLNDQLQLVQFSPNPRYDKNLYADYLKTEIRRLWRGCECVVYHHRLLVLVNRDKFSCPSCLDFYQALSYFLRESLLVAGMSRPFTGIKNIRSAYQQTKIALEFGTQETPTSWCYKFDDFALSYMLSKSTGELDPEAVCNEKLLKLMQYDADKNTAYLTTLMTYFQCKFNASATAKKLFIQRSTFLYRIDKIRELVGIDYESDDDVLHIILSIKILERKMKQL